MDTTNKKIIHIEVRDEYILGSGVSIGAMGSFGTMVLEATFDESWVGLTKYATWTDALGNVGEQILFTELDRAEDTSTYTYYIPVTAFPLCHAGTVKLSFTGYVVEGEKIRSVMNTATGTFRVLESNATMIDSESVDDNLAMQLTNTVNECTNQVADLRDRVEDVEAQNEVWKYAEGERVAGEKRREADEIMYANNDLARTESENYRIGQETLRQQSEGERVAAEIDRLENEASREKRFSEMESLVGDLPEALEAILALQESLIGGEEQ